MDQAPLVTAIAVGERGERGRSSTGFQLMWRMTTVHGKLVMKVDVPMSEKLRTGWRFG